MQLVEPIRGIATPGQVRTGSPATPQFRCRHFGRQEAAFFISQAAMPQPFVLRIKPSQWS
nr:hypothetical protein [Microvirga ossetica]